MSSSNLQDDLDRRARWLHSAGGRLEQVDTDRIAEVVAGHAGGLQGIAPLDVATIALRGLGDGATMADLDELLVRVAASLMSSEPDYSRLAARLLRELIAREVTSQGIDSFSQSVAAGAAAGLIDEGTAALVVGNAATFDDAVDPTGDNLFEYFGLRTVYDRYLLKDPVSRSVLEMPQHFFLRVACGLSGDAAEALDLYSLISSLQYLPGAQTLLNSGTAHPQLSACFVLDSPPDDLDAIFDCYKDVAQVSKFAGGIGLAFHRVRSRGSLIQGTNGLSNGIVPLLKVLDASVAAVSQGGRFKGAACVYLETWHADIEEFLELRNNTGDEARRTHSLNLANWIPDVFMERVRDGEDWSLFDPKKVPHLVDLYGPEFTEAYTQAEDEGLFERQVPTRKLYELMMRTLAETGNGWMAFKDRANACCNQAGSTGAGGPVVHSSNLCTEIIEVTEATETAVCNLGSVNLGRLVVGGRFSFDRLGGVVRAAVRCLDRALDVSSYPTGPTARSNARWRPIGLGVIGLQDVFFQLRLPFDSPEARDLSRRIAEEIYFTALWTSADLAETHGRHPGFAATRAAKGDLQFDLWGVTPSIPERWEPLRERIRRNGLRNSLLIAIAPTTSIAQVAGVYECIEPQVSNLFKRETLYGEFLQVNRYLVRDLQRLGVWDDDLIHELKASGGSVQGIDRVPADLKGLYRTAWELPMRSLIDMAAERGAFIDQSQSLNLFVESPTLGKLSSMYMHAWEQGLKTTYYLRSRPATRIAQTTTPTPPAGPALAGATCDLENPETCEACD